MANRTINIQVNANASSATGAVQTLAQQIAAARAQVNQLSQQPVVNQQALTQAVQGLGQLQTQANAATAAIAQTPGAIQAGLAPVETLRTQFAAARAEAQRLAAQPVVDQVALTAAIAETARLRDEMDEVNERVAVLTAGNPFEQLSNGIGDVGSKILALDFQGAAASAQNLITIGQNINFGQALTQLKALGQTFVQLGRVILTNPLFLLGALFAAIGYAIYKLLDALGVIKDVMEAFGAVLDIIINTLKTFTDWLGISSFAADEAAEAQLKNNDRLIASEQEKSNSYQKEVNRQIALAKAQGKDTYILEVEQQVMAAQSAKNNAKFHKERLNQLQILVNSEGEISEERRKQADAEIKGIKDAMEAYQDANNELKIIDANKQTADKEARDKELKETKDQNKKIASENAAEAKEAEAKRKQYAADRLAAARQIEDMQNSLILDQVTRETEINKDKYRRLREDAISNTKLTNDERKALIELFNKQEIADQAKIDQAAKDREDKKISDKKKQLEEYNTFVKGLETNTYIAQEQQIKDELAKNQKFLDDKKSMEEKSDALAVTAGEISKEQANANAILRAEQYEKDIIKTKEFANKKQIELTKIADDASEEELRNRLEAKLITQEEYEKRIAKIKEDAQKKADEKALELTKLNITKQLDLANSAATSLSDVTSSLNSINDQKNTEAADKKKAQDDAELQRLVDQRKKGEITEKQYQDAIKNNKIKNDNENLKAQEEIAKKRFKIEKGLALVQAGIAGALAVVKAAPNVPLMAFAAATSIASIAAIARSQYNGEASTAVDTSIPTEDANKTESTTPSFNLFGGGNNQNNVSGANNGGPGNNNNGTNITVSITEIENTAQKVTKIKENATL